MDSPVIGVDLVLYLNNSPVLYPWLAIEIISVEVLIPAAVTEVNLLVYPEPEFPILTDCMTLFLFAHSNSCIPAP